MIRRRPRATLLRFVWLLGAFVICWLPNRNFKASFYSTDVIWYARIVAALSENPRLFFDTYEIASIHQITAVAGEHRLKTIFNHNVWVRAPKYGFYYCSALAHWFLKKLPGWTAEQTLCLLALLSLLGTLLLLQTLALRFLPSIPADFLLIASLYPLASYPAQAFITMTPAYVHSSIFFLVLSWTLLLLGKRLFVASGVVAGLTLGFAPFAPVGIAFIGASVFAVGIWRGLSRQQMLQNVLWWIAGLISLVLLSEAVFQFFGNSFFNWFFWHMRMNVHENHVGGPFPKVPFLFERVGFELLPGLFTGTVWMLGFLLLGGYRKYRAFWFWLLPVGLLYVGLKLAPTVPVLRSTYIGLFAIQILVLGFILVYRKKPVAWVIALCLIVETFTMLPEVFALKRQREAGTMPKLQLFDDDVELARHSGAVPPDFISEFDPNRGRS